MAKRVQDSGGVDDTIKTSAALADVRYEIRGQLAHRAHELERLGYEIVSLNIGNPGLFGFRTPETMRLAMIENLGQAEPYRFVISSSRIQYIFRRHRSSTIWRRQCWGNTPERYSAKCSSIRTKRSRICMMPVRFDW